MYAERITEMHTHSHVQAERVSETVACGGMIASRAPCVHREGGRENGAERGMLRKNMKKVWNEGDTSVLRSLYPVPSHILPSFVCVCLSLS